MKIRRNAFIAEEKLTRYLLQPHLWTVSICDIEACEVNAMKPELYTEVSLLQNFPDENLKLGDVTIVVDYVAHPNGGEEGAILEIFNAVGESVRVCTVPVSAISAFRADQVPAVRSLA